MLLNILRSHKFTKSSGSFNLNESLSLHILLVCHEISLNLITWLRTLIQTQF